MQDRRDMSLHCTSSEGTKKKLEVGPFAGNIKILMRHRTKCFVDPTGQLRAAHLCG